MKGGLKMLGLAIRNTAKLVREHSKGENIRLGRLFTKKDTARLISDMLTFDEEKTSYTILDAGAGTGILAAAVIEAICKRAPSCKQIFLTCYENEPMFLPMLEDNLERIRKKCRHDYDVRLFVTIYEENYLTDVKNHYTVSFYGTVEDKFDIIVQNPPKELTEKGSAEAEGAGGITMTKLSMSYLFAKVAAEHLEDGGQLAVILPTTVASASALTNFRRTMASSLALTRIHLFVGKPKNFSRAIPLKKELVLCYKNTREHNDIVISASTDNGSKDKTIILNPLAYDFVVDSIDGTLTLPRSLEEMKIVKYIRTLPETLTSLGLKMSTGLIVDSKCKDVLFDDEVTGTIPIIRPGAMRGGRVIFPAKNVRKQYLLPVSSALFGRNKNLIVIKRVPAKSDERFLNAATYFAGQRPMNKYISTHNKINVIDTKDPADEMCARLMWGLFALLNSTIYDRYLSIVSKSKQINSKEMRDLPLPQRNVIENIGIRLMALGEASVTACDNIVNATFRITIK